MYVKHEMYNMEVDIIEAILVLKNKSDDGDVWILGSWPFKVIGRSAPQMQVSIVVFTNEPSTLAIQAPNIMTL